MGVLPKVKPFALDPTAKEPIDPTNKLLLSPVFLVDPMYTKKQKDEEIQVFRDNDFAGFLQPLKQSKFPLIRKEIQLFFNVGEDCTQHGMKLNIEGLEPRYLQMPLPRYYAPVWEPLYPPGAKAPKAHN